MSGGGDESKGARWATEDRTRKREALSINVTESHIKAMENNNSRPSNQEKAATGLSVILFMDSKLQWQVQINGDASMDRKSKGNNQRLLQVEVGVFGVGVGRGDYFMYIYIKKIWNKRQVIKDMCSTF